ncbi:MAG: acetyl-CoA carboxylase carboxyltransferase subunit beta [Alphaproteobacteria bacterium]|nr:acetyl-CoA carboxylase carboxyltransferase subunit beta [Alphaproteobacteria bacterium]
MNWLTNFVRPKLQALVRRAEAPESLWTACSSCGQMLYKRDLASSLKVCGQCGFHMRLGPTERLDMLFDKGTARPVEIPPVTLDPLRFRDRRRYTERLREAQGKHGERDAITVAAGEIGGHKAVVACFDFDFLGGSMGMAVGEGLIAAAGQAIGEGAALIAVPASGGARMQEGILSLMQMPRSTIAVSSVKEAGLPYIVLLTDPTTGGVSASFAMLGDIAIAEPGAVIGFTGQRVIQSTIRETLPEGFQRAEFLHAHGMVDMVVPRGELRATIARLLALLMSPKGGLPVAVVAEAAPEPG